MRLAVHLVTYQSMPDIVEALQSLGTQTFEQFRVVVVDNASNDGVFEFLSKEYGNRVVFLRNYHNLGFAEGHNQAIRFSLLKEPEFALVMNPDVVLQPNTIEELVKAMERHPCAGSIAARLLRPDGVTLDSTGLLARRSFHFSDRGSSTPAAEAYTTEEEVFGASGALALYRVAALTDVAIEGDYFDRHFFAYKEDVDLAWRLRLKGWECWYAPQAVAQHQRRIGTRDGGGMWDTLKRRRNRSRLIARWSYRNHWWLLMKNAPMRMLLGNAPFFLAREFFKALYLLIMETSVLGSIPETLRGLPMMYAKRRTILANTTVEPHALRQWFR